MTQTKQVGGLILAVFLAVGVGATPAAAQQWAASYGGAGQEYALAVQQTSDGGFITAGATESFGAGGRDGWIVKLDASGGIVWEKAYGSPGSEVWESIQQTSDGGYIVLGRTNSFGAGGFDFWVAKLFSDGTIDWQRTYGSTTDDFAYSIQQTTDGGYIAAGHTDATGWGDMWLLKLTSSGTITWQKSYGGGTGLDDWDGAYFVRQTSDGGYIATGETGYFGAGNHDIWVLKLDASGNVTWQKSYGGPLRDWASSAQEVTGGGFIVAGLTESFGAGGSDAWILKLDALGNVSWQNAYGGSGTDWLWSPVVEPAGGGYAVSGGSGDDAWLLRLDNLGNLTWDRGYGGTAYDEADPVQLTSDGGFVLAGLSTSFGAGQGDFWLLKVDAAGAISGCPSVRATATTVTPTTVSGVATTANPANTTVQPLTGSGLVTGSQAQLGQVCTTEAPEPIPALNPLGMALFVVVLGLGAILVLRRRTVTAGAR